MREESDLISLPLENSFIEDEFEKKCSHRKSRIECETRLQTKFDVASSTKL